MAVEGEGAPRSARDEAPVTAADFERLAGLSANVERDLLIAGLLNLRFFHAMSQRRIAEELGISQMHVCRLLAHACKQVREEAEEREQAVSDPVPAAA